MNEWDDFDPDDFEEEDERPDFRQLPVYQRGIDLLETVYALYEFLKLKDEEAGEKNAATARTEEEQEMMLRREVIGFMLEDAQIMLAKIAGAEGGDIYSIRLENAHIIKSHGRHLQVSCNSLFDVDNEYVQLIREKVHNFRIAFLEWVAGFDPTNDIKGEWDFH